ncbi:hypothetical protein FOE78_06860 [Microlunatus elymi]|uniref:Lipoprotein n=1 Tax=Microlunatus elymi TaxID=2596828 RepID=A0A516PX01_9ACTN|nr:hypothetical protein [Microlunatus elymi]QDP95662.1 hypothetical protein FOE78_06860 [Microlunatus elymi]
MRFRRLPRRHTSILLAATAATATVLLAGCDVSQGHVAGTAPGSSASQSSAVAPDTPGPSTPAASPASSVAASSGKPSIDQLQSGLASYFGLLPNMTSDQVRRAAACAAYPTFQELSTSGLTKIIKGQTADLRGADETSFQHVVTECITAAGGPGK